MKFKQGERVRSNAMYSKVYSLWNNIKERCYNKDNPKYKNYGAKGITMSKDWEDFDKFAADIDKVKGYNRSKLLSGEITLDKDQSNNNIYSLKSCKFVSRAENNAVKPNQQFKFNAVSPKGIKYNNITNQRQFCEKHNLNQSNVSKVLNGVRETNKYNGWTFIKQ